MKVTVGIVNYNLDRFLGDAIKSALVADEVIVVDDASTDESKNTILHYQEEHGIKAVFHDENSGSAVAGWHDIFEQATGDFVQLLSGDDVLMPETPELIREYGEHADFVYGSLELMDEAGRTLDYWNYERHPQDAVSALALGHRLKSNPVPFGFAAHRVSFAREHNLLAKEFPNLKYAADVATCLEWLANFPRIQRIADVTIRYRRWEGAETAKVDENRELLQQEIDAWYQERIGVRTTQLLDTVF